MSEALSWREEWILILSVGSPSLCSGSISTQPAVRQLRHRLEPLSYTRAPVYRAVHLVFARATFVPRKLRSHCALSYGASGLYSLRLINTIAYWVKNKGWVKMDKEKSTKNADPKTLFSGKATGISFDKFDEKVLSWGRKKFGEKYARALRSLIYLA